MARYPSTMPVPIPKPIFSSVSATASDTEVEPVTAITVSTVTTGTTNPSLRPDSTLSESRSRSGTSRSSTTAAPSAASVGARIAASSATSTTGMPGNNAELITVPSTMLSGNPTSRRRVGISASLRSSRRSIRTASLKRMTARATSATTPTAPSSASTSSTPVADNTAPTPTNTIGMVSGHDALTRETSAKATTRAPTSAMSAPSISAPPEAIDARRRRSRFGRPGLGLRLVGHDHIGQVEPDVEHGRRVREFPHRDVVHAGLGDGASGGEGQSAAGFEEDVRGETIAQCDGGAHVVEWKVVDQHLVGAGLDRFAEALEAVDLDLHRDRCLERPDAATGRRHTARRSDVVVLHECHVGEPHAVVHTATAAHRVLLELP